MKDFEKFSFKGPIIGEPLFPIRPNPKLCQMWKVDIDDIWLSLLCETMTFFSLSSPHCALYNRATGNWSMAWAKFITEEFGQSFHPLPYPCPNEAGFLKYRSKTNILNFSCKFLHAYYLFNLVFNFISMYVSGYIGTSRNKLKKYSVTKIVLTFHCLN